MTSPAVTIPSFTLNNGRSFPALGLGTWAFEASGDREILEQAIYDAISLGVRHIDTAWIYQVEDKVGSAVRRAIADGLCKREDLVIVTKVWVINLTKDRLPVQAKESLQNLGLDYIDVLLIHWPFPMIDGGKKEHFPRKADGSFNFDENVDLYNETWKAMEQCVDEGITKSIGLSNFTPAQIETLWANSRIKPVVNQVESSPLLPNTKILNVCKKYGIIMTAYQPFGGSPQPQKDGSMALTDPRKQLFESPIVKALADKYGKTIAQILLRFHIQRGVAVIPKSVSKTRIAENTQIFDFELTCEELDSLIGMETGQRVCYMPEALLSKYNPFADD